MNRQIVKSRERTCVQPVAGAEKISTLVRGLEQSRAVYNCTFVDNYRRQQLEAGAGEEEAGGIRGAPDGWRVQAVEDDVRLWLSSNVLAVCRYGWVVRLASCYSG